MVSQDFAEAIVHKDHRVLGVRLLPFSFWHAALLDLHESPFAGHKTAFDFAALFLAIEICRCKYPDRPRLRLGRVARLLRFLRIKRYAKRYYAELSAFSDYIVDHCSGPELIPIGGDEDTAMDPAPVKTPWYLFNVASLAAGRIVDSAAAWNTPVGYGKWWFAASAETRGAKIDMVTDEDREHELSEEEFLANERDEVAYQSGADRD